LIISRFNSFKSISIILSINTLCLLIIRSLLQIFDIDLNTIKHNYFSIIEYENSYFVLFELFIQNRIVFIKYSFIKVSMLFIYLPMNLTVRHLIMNFLH
jgi:hypothetical protein